MSQLKMGMKEMRGVAAAVAALVLCAASAYADLPKEAQAMMQKAEGLKSYRAKFTLIATGEKPDEKVELNGTLLFEKPNHRRLEIRKDPTTEPAQMIVSDGKTEWQYDSTANVVYRLNDPPDTPGPHKPFAEAQSDTLEFVQKIGTGPDARLRFKGQPVASISEGSPVPIQSIQVDVAEQDGLVRELSLLDEKGEAVLSQQYKDVEVNVAVPKDAFIYTPPKGLTVIDMEPPAPTPKNQGG